MSAESDGSRLAELRTQCEAKEGGMLVSGKRLYLSQGDVELLALICDVSEAAIRTIDEPRALQEFLKANAREKPDDCSEIRLARRLLLPRYLAALGDEAARDLPWCIAS